ncbi:hypothetical protein J1N35_038365, partial [Gossypium stocksii]
MAQVLHLLQILHNSCEQQRVAYIQTQNSRLQAHFTFRVSNDVKERLRHEKERNNKCSNELYHVFMEMIEM